MVRMIGYGIVRGPWRPARMPRTEWGSARTAVLGVLREAAGQSLSAAEVWKRLGRDVWQRQTVRAAMKRLARAGVLLVLRGKGRPRFALLGE